MEFTGKSILPGCGIIRPQVLQYDEFFQERRKRVKSLGIGDLRSHCDVALLQRKGRRQMLPWLKRGTGTTLGWISLPATRNLLQKRIIGLKVFE
ncbi:hypothetical protein AVEN_259557-1 [Araneus ventricosus]|uniref:Uncharacterized protein n=1 Tax=Araneus ventricosus TaxID=182803 RepID=A0A4Y2ES09_ARAVE|nr:hypothetical protein AVEN_259557-1 [Araneus ventricosus]